MVSIGLVVPRRFSVVLSGYHRFSVVPIGSQLFSVVPMSSQWICVILIDSQWFPVVLGVSLIGCSLSVVTRYSYYWL